MGCHINSYNSILRPQWSLKGKNTCLGFAWELMCSKWPITAGSDDQLFIETPRSPNLLFYQVKHGNSS